MKLTSAVLTISVLYGVSMLSSCEKKSANEIRLDTAFDKFISSIYIDSLKDVQPEIVVKNLTENLVHISIRYQLTNAIRQDDWKVTIRPAFKPAFHWAPHLTPTDQHIIAQHVFRSPALIVSDSARQLVIIPDLDKIQTSGVPWYMDVDAVDETLVIGASRSKVPEHVLFVRDSGLVISPPVFDFGFYIMVNDDKVSLADPWRKPLAFLWEKWGKPLYDKGEPINGDLEPYVKHTYRWAFDTWGKQVWQEFSLNGKRVGAPVFIVNVTQSPNYPGQVNEREFRSIWNQAWFSSLRSAQGLYRYARRTNNKALLEKAVMTKELALMFPQTNGLFPSVIATQMEQVEVNGKKLKRSKGWGTYYFGNSNRNPVQTWGGADLAPLHVLDMSWTAYLMLTWYDDLERDKRLLAYATRYADRLMTLQQPDGFFPAWLDNKTSVPLPVLQQSPETSMSVTFLVKAYQLTKKEAYMASARRAMDAVNGSVVPVGRWEDFETYWSCSRVLDSLVGKKIERNDAFKQNTLSMFWTAEANYYIYKQTGNKTYLQTGQRVLDELLMYQASWQPPFIAIHALGGFGVMNGDGEWNDSRQSLFAELILRYGQESGTQEYNERGMAALRSSFVMMYCPENPETMQQWEKVYPFFNEKDYGFMMENYGHGGETNAEGLGIGEFTIYDWGNGAAAEAYNRIIDHFGEVD